METVFSQAFGFTNAYCWWAATVTIDPVQPRKLRNWLLMLYLAFNFSSMDPRDVIYGLRGMIEIDKGAGLQSLITQSQSLKSIGILSKQHSSISIKQTFYFTSIVPRILHGCHDGTYLCCFGTLFDLVNHYHGDLLRKQVQFGTVSYLPPLRTPRHSCV